MGLEIFLLRVYNERKAKQYRRFHRVWVKGCVVMTEMKSKFDRHSKKRTMDMTEGPLFSKIIRYSIPLILTSLPL